MKAFLFWIAILGSLFLIGYVSSNVASKGKDVPRQYMFPGNTGRQIERHVETKGELLMRYPLLWRIQAQWV